MNRADVVEESTSALISAAVDVLNETCLVGLPSRQSRINAAIRKLVAAVAVLEDYEQGGATENGPG